jgi:hypothetical protein
MAIALVLSIIALAASIAALVIALKNGRRTEVVKTVEKEKTVTVYAPVEHPFTYDDVTASYRLNGNLYVDGIVACMNFKNMEG